MKTKKFFANALIALCVFAICTTSCSGDENEPTPAPKERKGEVSYVINNGNGGGSTTAPTVVTKGEPLNMTISQKASYTDSDGKVFSCEPKATISLKVTTDTVRVKNLTALTSVKQKGNPSTSTNGTNPAQTKIAQVFDVSGQEVTFDLGYEVYRYANAANQEIEMPYIKLNPAAYGSAKTAQTTRGMASVIGIKLTPITPAVTRGETVVETTMYKVNVSFNLDMQTKNTGKDETTPLAFEAEFVGVVESTTELPNPTMDFSYQLNILGGTKSTASPFAVTLGEEFSLEWEQTSQYTYFSATELNGKTVGEKPKATVKISVAKDTLWVNSVDEIEKVTTATPVETTDGENPIKHTTKQSFDIGGKTISLDWSYEAYSKAIINNQEVELPYLELSKAEVTSVSKKALSSEAISDRHAKAYEIEVHIQQSLKGVNTPNEVAETVEYIVKYIAAVASEPLTRFSYDLNILSGTKSKASPFVVTLGETFSLEWVQTSQYIYFSETLHTGKTVEKKPKATVKLTVTKDTLWVNSVDEIEKVTTTTPVETTGKENPSKHKKQQSFDIGGKVIGIESIYEVYAKETIGGKDVNLPYLELGEAEVTSVTKAEINAESVSGKAAKAYDVTVTLRQSLKGQNTPNEVAETVEYIVKYIAAMEVKLISTTYEKDYEWLGPWCDLPWGYNYIVRRVRTYSTGEKETDKFVLPTGNMAVAESWTNHDLEVDSQLGPYHVIYHKSHYHSNMFDENINEFRSISTTKTGVSNLELLNWKISTDKDDWNLRDFNYYEMIHSDKLFNPSSPEENWYGRGFSRERAVSIMYSEDLQLTREYARISYADWFLYIDGQIIDFSEYRMVYDCDVRVEDTKLNDGTSAKVFTNEIKAKYLGKDFYAAFVDTVYQIK